MSCPFVMLLGSVIRFTSHLVESLNAGKFWSCFLCFHCVFSSMKGLRSHSDDCNFQ